MQVKFRKEKGKGVNFFFVENQIMLTSEQFSQLLPLAVDWAKEQESYISQNGIFLSNGQIKDARLIPVKHPEKVRLLKVNAIPLPDNPFLRTAAKSTGLITFKTIGLTLRYGIFIRSDYWNHKKVIMHELVHVSQYERLGSIFNFLQKYLQECIEIGYPQAPMEQEAINKAKKIQKG